MSDVRGTIAVLHRGKILADLSDWLGSMREQYPGQLWVPPRIRGNQIARQRGGVSERLQGQWVLFVDSDVVPSRDALQRLLAREVPVVAGVVYERFPVNHDGQTTFLVAATREGRKLRDKEVRPSVGLLPVTTVGMACTLIRREVFDQLGPPYFRCGQLDPEFLDEDSEFCLRVAALGIPVYLDCTVRAGHAVEGIAWPGADGRRWIEWVGPQDVREPAPEILVEGLNVTG